MTKKPTNHLKRLIGTLLSISLFLFVDFTLAGWVAHTSVGIGKNSNSSEGAGESEFLVAGVVGSRSGNSTLVADKDLNVIASKVSAKNNITLQGENVNVLAAASDSSSSFSSKSKGWGFSVGVTYSPTLAAASAYKKNKDSGEFSGCTVGQWMEHDMGVLKGSMAAMTPIVVTAGNSRNSSNKGATYTDAVVSELNAGGHLTVVATDGDINSLGTQISAEGDAFLSAYNV